MSKFAFYYLWMWAIVGIIGMPSYIAVEFFVYFKENTWNLTSILCFAFALTLTMMTMLIIYPLWATFCKQMNEMENV